MTTTLPRSVQALVTDAETAGYTVKVVNWVGGVDVTLGRDGEHVATFVWAQTLTGAANGRGYFTSGQQGTRFQYGSYTSCGRPAESRSITRIRRDIGLPA